MPKPRTPFQVIEYYNALSLRFLLDAGYFQAGKTTRGSTTWWLGEHNRGSAALQVRCEGETESLFITPDHRTRQSIRVVQQPSNLGRGNVRYFVCPRTGNRCRKLYEIHGQFLSRHCLPKGALYEGQTKSKRDRRPMCRPEFNGLSSYGGRPTRAYRRYWKKYRRWAKYWLEIGAARGIPGQAEALDRHFG